MLPNWEIGLLLMIVTFIALFVEYVWREVVGRPTTAMILFWQFLLIPMGIGLFMFCERFGWGVAVRGGVGVVGGIVLWIVSYMICGVIYAVIRPRN
ncbi:MAG TPA: hypothetical protein PLI09_06675 [Candidatus Hydrogenedentes bacterium]|nr:hypothetical protein [Candidatus Hydrogenedentota bacterium]